MARFLALFGLFIVPSIAWAKHGPMDLEEKVRRSQLIMVGTVREVRDAESPPRDAEPIYETSRRCAAVDVEVVLRGAEDLDRVDVGFNSLYRCDTTSLEPGQRYLFFLCKARGPFYVTVNWQYGAMEIVDGATADPRNVLEQKRVPLDECLAVVREVIAAQAADPGKVLEAAAEEEGVPLGEAGFWSVALWRVGDTYRVRFTFTSLPDIKEIDGDELEVSLLAKGREALELVGRPDRIEVSIDFRPTFIFVASVPFGDLTSVEVRFRGELRVLNVPSSAPPNGGKDRTPKCPGCGSDAGVIPIVYGRPGSELMAQADRGEVKLGGFMVSSECWYCGACRKRW